MSHFLLGFLIIKGITPASRHFCFRKFGNKPLVLYDKLHSKFQFVYSRLNFPY